MKQIIFTTLIFGLLLFGCNQSDNKTTYVTEEITSVLTDDKEDIKNLIRQVFAWADSKKSINLVPVLTDSKDSLYIGLDLDKHEQNLEKLRQTNLFATEFIENYNQIILTLDNGLRNENYEQWLVGDLPTFSFANGWNPWCCAQSDCLEESFQIEIIKIDNNVGELKYKREKDSSWIDFIFRIKKENGTWKISYLQGFDFKVGTKRDGEL